MADVVVSGTVDLLIIAMFASIVSKIVGWILDNLAVFVAVIPGCIGLGLSIHNAIQRKREERLDVSFIVDAMHGALSPTGDFLWIWFDIFLVNPSSRPNAVWSMVIHFREGLTKEGKPQEVSAPVLEEIPYHPSIPGQPPGIVKRLAELAFPMFVREEDLPVGLDTTKLLKPPVSLPPFSTTEKKSVVVLLRSPSYALAPPEPARRITISYKDLRGEHKCPLFG